MTGIVKFDIYFEFYSIKERSKAILNCAILCTNRFDNESGLNLMLFFQNVDYHMLKNGNGFMDE